MVQTKGLHNFDDEPDVIAEQAIFKLHKELLDSEFDAVISYDGAFGVLELLLAHFKLTKNERHFDWPALILGNLFHATTFTFLLFNL